MQTTNAACLGLYEKALPADLSWPQRLATAAELGFEFVEMSIDEQPARQQRLDWDRRQRLAFIQARLDSGVTVPSLCLSAHRRDPFGSADAATRERARVLMSKALELATDLASATSSWRATTSITNLPLATAAHALSRACSGRRNRPPGRR